MGNSRCVFTKFLFSATGKDRSRCLHRLSLTILFLCLTGGAEQAAGVQDAMLLESGKPIERELAGGPGHAYRIGLDADQFLNLIVEQRGIDVVVRLHGPGGKIVTVSDFEKRPRGQESMSIVAEAAGEYRVSVQASQPNPAGARYEIRVAELRAATPRDRALFTARKSMDEAGNLFRAGRFDDGRLRVERALEIYEKELGPTDPLIAAALSNLALIYQYKGAYQKAEGLFQRSLDIQEKSRGSEHPNVGNTLNNLGRLYQVTLDFEKAESFYRRSLAVMEKAFGEEHTEIVLPLNNLASLYKDKGQSAKAELLYLRAIAIQERALGPEHLAVADTLNNLAELYLAKRDYGKAEPLFQRSLAIREKMLGSQTLPVAQSLNELASLYTYRSDYARAESLYRRAIAIWEKVLGPEHTFVAAGLNGLGLLYATQEEYGKAEPLYQRALAIREKVHGPEHPWVAVVLNNLGLLFRNTGDYARARTMYERALAIRQKKLGAEHPEVIQSLRNLANLYKAEGDYDKAGSYYNRALSISEKELGPDDMSVAGLLQNLGILSAAKGDANQAGIYLSRAGEIGERNLVRRLGDDSERQKLTDLRKMSSTTDLSVSLHLSSPSSDPSLRRQALTLILQRKGRALDAMADSLGALRRRSNTEDRALLDRLKETNEQLAERVLNGRGKQNRAEHQREIKTLEEQKEKLEAEISRRSSEFQAQTQPVTLAAVQAVIPADAAAIEYFSYRPFNPKYSRLEQAYGNRRYVAYVLRREGDVECKDLGEAAFIDAAVEKLRRALRDPRGRHVKQQAREVDQLLLQPLRPLLGDAREILLSPDGAQSRALRGAGRSAAAVSGEPL